MKRTRIAAGVLVWAASAWGLWWSVDAGLVADGSIRGRLVPQLWQHLVGSTPRVDLVMQEPLSLEVGDPIFVIAGPTSVNQVGEVRVVLDPQSRRPTRRAVTDSAQALFYPSTPGLSADSQLTYYTSSQSMAWVLQTMMPPEKRQQIELELSDAVRRHHAEILQTLRPVVEAALYEAIQVVEEDLGEAIARHRPEIERLGARYQRDLVQKEIVPLVKQEIWPIVQEHAEPAADEIGTEIWRRVSLWRFAWRYIYDVTPLPERNRLQQEWERFVEQEVVPVLEDHSQELVGVVQKVLSDAARNEKVRTAVRKSLTQVIEDPELQKIVWQIVREVVVENPRLRDALDQQFQAPQARKALQIAATRFEPTVRRIGDLLFGTRESGITPEFARVLRNQILGKDRRWLVLESAVDIENASTQSNGLVLPVRRGEAPAANPFLPARARSDDVRNR